MIMFSLLVSASLASASLALPQSEGPLATTPHAFSVSTGTKSVATVLDESEIYFKEEGWTSLSPVLYTPRPAFPDFRISSIMVGATAPLPDVDAMSIGMDWILSDNLGRSVVPDNSWGALSFAVTPGTTGSLLPISLESTAADGASADLFVYGLPGSVLPPLWVDAVTLAMNSDEINIGEVGNADNIDAHDIFMAAYRQDPAFAAVLPPAPRVYFSVSTATLGRVPAAWWATPAGGAVVASGAVVFICQWLPGTATWTEPRAAVGALTLGLDVGDDVDALAVDEVNLKFLFSTNKASVDPIRIAILGGPTGISIFDYSLSDGTKVSTRLGLTGIGDDIDAICALDPGHGPAQQFMPAVLGNSDPNVPPVLPAQAKVTAAVHRFFQGGNDWVDAWVVGWPSAMGPQPGAAAVSVSIPTNPLIPLTFLGLFQRNPANPVQGDPQHIQIQIPPAATLIGTPVLFHWLMADGFGQDLPYPVQIII